jgi:hypothetical protein
LIQMLCQWQPIMTSSESEPTNALVTVVMLHWALPNHQRSPEAARFFSGEYFSNWTFALDVGFIRL